MNEDITDHFFASNQLNHFPPINRRWRQLARDSSISTDLNFARNLHPDDVELIRHLKRNPNLRLLNLAGMCSSSSFLCIAHIDDKVISTLQIHRFNELLCSFFLT